MLNFLGRRRSSQDATDGPAAPTASDDVDGTDSAVAQKRHSLRSTTSFCDEVFLEVDEEGGVGVGGGALSDGISLCSNDDIFSYHSRLSMNLASIVSDPNCLSYFVQYLDTRQALPLIKFYLDIENFKRAAALTQETEQTEVEDEDNSPPPATDSTSSLNNNNKSDNDVPELKTLCDLSMRKPLTDDEKSQIYAETNKQIINRQKSGSGPASLPNISELSRASISDAIAIYQKYLIVNASLQVELPIVILAHISLLLCGRDKAECSKPIPASCFDEAREFVLEQLERDHVLGFLQSGYYSTYCLELVEGGSINIYDVLYSELALFYFTEYLEQRQERECLEFWITGINFRKSFAPGEDDEAAQTDAMIIYDRYFSLQSDCRLWMSQKLRLRVEQAICAPGEQWQAFDLALLVTAKYLEQKYFADFLRSHIFDNYVNELKIKRDNSASSHSNLLQHKPSLRRTGKTTNIQRHRKALSMSDCTHISQHNTLLASMDTLPSKATINQQQSGNLNIDARQLTNPQLLWQRPFVGTLKFGFVNSLGRYERDFEAVDAVALKSQPWSLSVSGSKIKNAMRKLVNLPEDNVQEEIAWQVAEMIVKDVTSVTLSGKTSPPPLA
ncbi:hypothetical protein KR200_006678 [Drosophila serrata]|nr:hypothetical protein KR200_006678 [Drosophila serrata]